jgi:peptidoglycan/xylan/chitin deacetylase (PgdA/CDA1 family)
MAGARSNDPLPAYYTRLAPFIGAFARGRAALTYHKLGPRPAAVRLKGLYVSEHLFGTQLSELRSAGVRSCRLDDQLVPSGDAPVGDILAITFDDGFESVLRHGLDPLAKNGFQAIQFLVSDLIGQSNEWEQHEGEAAERLMDASQIREWLAAGHDIGAHSKRHPRLTTLDRERAKEEITGSKKTLEDLFGREIRHFCYPYGDWNRDVRDHVEAAGFVTACTTNPGVNLPGDDPFTLKRFTARYASRNWRMLGRVLTGWWSRRKR